VEDEVVPGGETLRDVTVQLPTRVHSNLEDELSSLDSRSEVRGLTVIVH